MLNPTQFETLVDDCRTEVTEYLPAIAERHSSYALLAALAEHVGGALQLVMRAGHCTPEEARAVLARCEQLAFRTPEDRSDAAPGR
jgi:hypothetical protein